MQKSFRILLAVALVTLAGCELIVHPDIGLVPTVDASCTVCLDDADTVVDIDGDLEIVPSVDASAYDAAADASVADADSDAHTGE